MIKKALVMGWLMVILAAICYQFWSNEVKYTLPTPVPKAYIAVNAGEIVDVSGKINHNNGKPVFIHFFNPDCPCSRFNIPHFQALVKKYGNAIDFSVVVVDKNKDKDYTVDEIANKYDLQVPISFDTSLASVCGVYSTPQAVLINTDHKLYYRGNYNKSRWCTDKNSNFAEMAIDSLLNKNDMPTFSPLATTAYGCELPKCNKQ